VQWQAYENHSQKARNEMLDRRIESLLALAATLREGSLPGLWADRAGVKITALKTTKQATIKRKL